jgi:hypothetical protein
MASIAEGDGWLLVVGEIFILKWNSTSLLHPHDIPFRTPHVKVEASTPWKPSPLPWNLVEWISGSWWLA